MNSHCNYLLQFSDGSIKVGVTARIQQRVREISNMKRGVAKLVKAIHLPYCNKIEAFKIEADLCRLVSSKAESGKREWFSGGDDAFHYLHQTAGMFWCLVVPMDDRGVLKHGLPFTEVQV